MKRKYLDDIDITDRPDLWNPHDSRQKQWKKERSIYGFDERETWGMDFTFYCWLYERLMRFLDVANFDMNYHEFEYEGEVLTQKQCIDRMLEGLKIALTKNWTEQTDDDSKKVDDIAHIWALVLPAMWW